jgi:TolB protein
VEALALLLVALTGQIAFGSGDRVHVVAPDGSGERILRTRGDASWPAWSRDGRRVAFTSVGRRGIFVMNADGSGLRRVTTTKSLDLQPTWSPDGRRIAFARFVPGFREEIFVVGVNGRGLRRLTRNRGQDLEPDWSPNGKRIAWAFTSTRTVGATPAIHTTNPDGRFKRRVTDGSAPDWSPDGRRFAYSVNGEIFTGEVSGRGRVEVTFSLGAADVRPEWSPDGTHIAFLSSRGSPREELRLFRIEAGGGDPTLVSPVVPVSSASWGPGP